MKKLLYSFFFLLLLQSCEEKKAEFPAKINNFVLDKSISKSTVSTGILDFTILNSTENSVSFQTNAVESNINGQTVNLNNEKFTIIKDSENLLIKSRLGGDSEFSLDFVNGIFEFSHGNFKKTIRNIQEVPVLLDGIDQINFFVLLTVLGDRTHNDLVRVDGSKGRKLKYEYRYTVGWGTTLTAAFDDADRGNAYYAAVYQANSCYLSGRDWGCLFGQLYCVVVDTWICG